MRRRTRQSARGRDTAYRQEREEQAWQEYVPETDQVAEPEPVVEVAPEAELTEADDPYIPAFTSPPRRKKPFYSALAVSAVLHLSSVTLFSVVVYFPRQDLRYFEFSLVQASTNFAVASATTGASDRLRLGRVADGFTELPPDDRARDGFSLPEIELPTLEFAELSRLRIRQESASDLSRYDELVRPAPRDPWEYIEVGVGRVRDRLADFNLPLGLDLPEPPTSAPTVIQPAAGFEGRIDWGLGAPSRPLLFAPPMTALSGIDPDSLADEIEIVFQVNSEGRVTNVWSPSLESPELLDSIQLSVLRYRFEPLDTVASSEQTATLYLGPVRTAP